MYDAGGLLPVDGVDPGSTLLLSGPPMTGKRGLALRLLAAGFDHGEAAAVVSTDTSAADIRAALADAYGGPIDQFPVGVVDCIGQMQADSDLAPLDARLNSPADLTGIGMELTDVLETLYSAHSERFRVGLLSLTTMTMYVSAAQVIRFLHVFANRIGDADAVGIVVAHSDTMDDETLQQLRSFVDGVVEFRETADGAVELRVIGLDVRETAWTPLDRSRWESGTPAEQATPTPADDAIVPESLRAVLEAVRSDSPTLTVCNYDGTDAALAELRDYFDRRNVRVRTATLDADEPRSVALLHHGDDLLGAETVTSLRNAIQFHTDEDGSFGTRQIPGLLTRLEHSVFGASAADKPLLIDVSHLIEQLAERTGGGRLHAGFQRFSRLVDDERSARIYRRLAESGVDVHVYGVQDDEIPYDDVTAHGFSDEEIAESWFVVYDGNGDPSHQASLLAIERDDSGAFDGFWTYDSDITRRLDAYLNQTYVVPESLDRDVATD